MPDKPETKRQQSLDAFWGKADDLEQILVDHLYLQRINDQFYLTFGQVRAPQAQDVPTERAVAEIRPVARLVASKKAIKSMLEVLNRNVEE